MKKKILCLVGCLFVITILSSGCSKATQPAAKTTKYPGKPITIIVPFSVGGGLDLAARALEKGAAKQLGQPLIVVNKPGGAGAVGWNELAGSSPDGYTIGMVAADMLCLPLYDSTKYNYPTALEPLAQVSAVPMVIAIQTGQPWQTLDELIAYGKSHPGQLKFGHGGVGSFPHVIGELFGEAAGIKMEQVPFRGAGEVTTALLGGHVQLIVVNPMVVKEHVRNGTVKVLAVTGEKRLKEPLLADVPTFKEQGLNVMLNNWYGVAAPKDLPIEVKTELEAGLKAAVTDPEFQQEMNNMGLQVEYVDARGFGEKWLADNRIFTRVVQETGILDVIKAQKK
ncbi:MAG: tripartite tricarboxylate transporter substrate binding protein [Veillonellales bacterium]